MPDAQAGAEIIEALCTNSATFETKTEFAQDKYIKRKSKKYVVRVTLRRPTARVLCECMFEKSGGTRTHNLRADTLAAALSLANAAANSRVLVIESCGGLLTAAAAERLGGHGKVCAAAAGDKRAAPIDAVRHLNLSERERSVLRTTTLQALLDAARRVAAANAPAAAAAVAGEAGAAGQAAAEAGAAAPAEGEAAAAAPAATPAAAAAPAPAPAAPAPQLPEPAAAPAPAPAPQSCSAEAALDELYGSAGEAPHLQSRPLAVVAAGSLVADEEVEAAEETGAADAMDTDGQQQQLEEEGEKQQQQQQQGQQQKQGYAASPQDLEHLLQPGGAMAGASGAGLAHRANSPRGCCLPLAGSTWLPIAGCCPN
jgi:tRNA (adenine-N(1)-)-methyltransferase non-catalytic subunit